MKYREVLDEVQPHWVTAAIGIASLLAGILGGAASSQNAKMQGAAADLKSKQQGARPTYQPTARMFEAPGAAFGNTQNTMGTYGGSDGGTNVLRPNDITSSAIPSARVETPDSPASSPVGQHGGTSTPGTLDTAYQRKNTYGYDPNTAGQQPPKAAGSNWTDNAQAAMGLAQSLSALAQGPAMQGGGIPQGGPAVGGYQPTAYNWQKRRMAGY